jgi:hypothetical protein
VPATSRPFVLFRLLICEQERQPEGLGETNDLEFSSPLLPMFTRCRAVSVTPAEEERLVE